jgi:single-strand DNA-binding protein
MESDAFPRINRVIVTGFIQQQPELRHTPSGVPVSSFRVRTGRLLRDRRGLVRETVSTFTVVVWQDLAVRVCQEAGLGQGVTVEGSLHSRSFVAASGERRTVLEVYADVLETAPVFLSSRELRGGGAGRDGDLHPEERDGRGDERPHPGELPGDHQSGHASGRERGNEPTPLGDSPDRVAEGRVAEGRVAEDRVAEDRIAEDRVPQDRVARDRDAEGRVKLDPGDGAGPAGD